MADGPRTDWALVERGDIPDALDHLASLLRPMDRPVPKMSTCVHVEVALHVLGERLRREGGCGASRGHRTPGDPASIDDAPVQGAPRRNSVTRRHLKEVAAVYRRAIDDGLPPTKAVAEHFGASHSTAARWVSMARAPENAFLGPASRGRSGEGGR